MSVVPYPSLRMPDLDRLAPLARRAAATTLLAGATLGAAACGGAGPEPVATAAPASADIHSHARPSEARVTHVALDLRADFDARRLSGTATLDLERAPGSSAVVLDTRDLAIESVTDTAGHALQFELGPTDSIRGQPLTVELPEGVKRIVVGYRTSPDAAALQWLSPAQTAGKKHPYLFSQGQAILTRTWIPTQDSPGIRQTYEARIVVPEPLTAVMSAEQLTPKGEPAEGGRAFRFRLDQPVPPYLIAIAAGDLAFRELGPRTGVYAEPSVVDSAAREFADLEKMVQAAERLYGPYRWGRYDILVLPPSFPFGGMENPRLTFATPTILAGDKSLVSLVAHELAHSWSGNLVTNATWSDFWLNEGFTTYIENRIMEAVYGPERARMLQVLDRRDLQAEIKGFGADTAQTVLHINLAGRNPDDGMTDIPYNKGALFLRTIEQAVGRERFDSYLRSYFDRHAFQSITTEQFLADLREHLIKGDAELEKRIRPEEWVYAAGLPDNAPVPQSEAFERVEAQARRFAEGTPAAQLETKGWSTQEWQHFIGSLPQPMTEAQMADLDRAFHFTNTGNSEILFAWLRTAIRERYQPAMPALERFLTTQGRRKFLAPLYTDLMNTDWGKAEARRIYQVARPGYHAVSVRTIDEIVKGE
ncbi:MAG TPA: M1 family metallopeptidase [Gemmatimonadaceae bacterium]|nr:M1 family metallopeptidase [Gemmatimonadaceae bacterium]